MDRTKKLPWNVCILRPEREGEREREREREKRETRGRMQHLSGKERSVCTFSTSDSHHSFKPNITSEIPSERKKNLIITTCYHVTVM